MAQEKHYEVRAREAEVITRYGQCVGNTSSNPTIPTSPHINYIKTITHSSTGTFAGTFDKSYPQLMSPLVVISGTTAGLKGRFSAIDVTAGTFTLITEVGSVATDPATTDNIYFDIDVRNSGRNK